MAISFVTTSTTSAADTTIIEKQTRTFLRVQNLDATNHIFINFGVAAVASQCLRVAAGQTLDLEVQKLPIITKQLNVIAGAGAPVYIAVDNT